MGRHNIVGNGNIVAKGDVNIFSPEWVEKNPWMDEANKEEQRKAEIPPPNMMCMFINYSNGIPVKKLREEWDRMENWQKDQDSRLAIFHEMMSEKGIRAGRNGVGEPHRGWGASKRKY